MVTHDTIASPTVGIVRFNFFPQLCQVKVYLITVLICISMIIISEITMISYLCCHSHFLFCENQFSKFACFSVGSFFLLCYTNYLCSLHTKSLANFKCCKYFIFFCILSFNFFRKSFL